MFKGFLHNNKKLIIFTVLIVAITTIALAIYVNNDTLPSKNIPKDNVSYSSISQDDIESMFQSGYVLFVGNDNFCETSHSTIYIDNLKDELQVDFTNMSGKNEKSKFILKIFYDYKEINFKVGDGIFNNEYEFSLDDSTKISLSVYLSDEVQKDDKSHKLLVSVLAAPQKHAKEIDAMTNFYGTTYAYDVVFSEGNKKFFTEHKFDKPMKEYKCQYQGLMINIDFDNFSEKEVYFPPTFITSKTSEKIQLAYRMGNYSGIEEYLMIILLDWKQCYFDDKPYKLLRIADSKIGYGTFDIIAPDKPGLYEIVGYVVPAPFEDKGLYDYRQIDTSYRFTLEVQE
ncbi:UNVERIFIED_CONTAM: hypothetical protein Cloal_4174 [Acetivibrio alkalicellulosi]